MNVLLILIHVMKMLIAVTLMVASRAHASLGTLGMEKHAKVSYRICIYIDYSVFFSICIPTYVQTCISSEFRY